MAEYNKVMTQIKPDLPKVIDTEQIYVYVPKATYDQAGIVKPDQTQFVIAGDYTLTIKHFEMTDDHVAVDVKMGYKNDTAFADLADKDFVSKSNLTDYSVERIPNKDDHDKAYVESKTGTKLVRIDKSAVADTIAVRDADGALHAEMHDTPQADELVHYTYLSKHYVKATTNGNKVYATDAAGRLIYAPFSSAASTDTFVIRQPDGSIRGNVSTPEDTTLLNHQYVRSHYIPVGSDGKIPNSYLPADIGADEIVSGYYSAGVFWTGEGLDFENSTWLLNDSLTAWNAGEIETPLQYFKDGSSGTANIRVLTADNVLSDVSVRSVKMFDRVDYESNSEQILRFAKENDESAGVVCTSSNTGSIWQYKVSDSVIYNATVAAVKQALRTIVFSQYPDYTDFQRWLKTNAVQIDGPTPIAGDPNKLYVDLNTNQTYRWDDASGYVSVGSALALGTSHDTAYYGDFGDAAYAHSRSKGNPHNTRIADIPNLEATLNGKVGVYGVSYDANRVVAFLADQNSTVMCTVYNWDRRGTFYTKSTGSTEWTEINSTTFLSGGITWLRSEYEPQIKITTKYKPKINGALMTSSSITLPMGMELYIEFDTTSPGSSTDYFLNFAAANERFVAYFWQHSNVADAGIYGANCYKIPMYDANGRLKTGTPGSDFDAVNFIYWKNNYKPFNYTTISTLSSVDKGFNVEYQVNGKSAEIEIPLEGTDDIVVDIDETNKMINIHLDAKVRAKLAKMLTLPAEAPAKNSIVGVGTNNAQMIMTEQEARDAISVFKTVSLTQTEYNNLAVKDNKTLYLITG